jgi:transposase
VNDEKYIGLDVHQATIVVAVLDSTGKLIMESILATEAATILQFFAGLRGTLSVTFEEGTWSAWLYDLLKPHVDKLVVCNPRKNALLKDGNKNDRIDARKLAELLRGNQLKPVYHGENGVRMLRELSRLSDHRQRSVAGDEPTESGVPKLGDSLRRKGRLLSSASSAVAGQDSGSRRAATSGATL